MPPLILDPESLPVVGVDAHLPALPPEALTPQALRRRLANIGRWQPEHVGDGSFGRSEPSLRSRAAVLIALIDRPGGLQVLLTRRTEHLRAHAGQISFPGGRSEPADDSPAVTALREAQEETGLPPAQVEVIGVMPPYLTVTGFVVTPVVGLVSAPFEAVLDSFEVAEVFEVPLAFLMNPAHHEHRVFAHEGGQRHFLAMPWPGQGDGLSDRGYFIWGATAAMLRNLYRFLADAAEA